MEILAVETAMEGAAGLHRTIPDCLHDLQVLNISKYIPEIPFLKYIF